MFAYLGKRAESSSLDFREGPRPCHLFLGCGEMGSARVLISFLCKGRELSCSQEGQTLAWDHTVMLPILRLWFWEFMF